MRFTRQTPHNSPVRSAFRRPLCGLALWVVLLAAVASGGPAAAQAPAGSAPSGGGAETAPSGGAEAAPSAGAAGGVPVVPPGSGPLTLPPPPGGGFGIPNPAAPPYSVSGDIPTLVSPPSLRLFPAHAGVVPLQAYDPNAPAILIQPNAALGEMFTDNVNFVHSPRRFAAITTLAAGASVSADTPRLQAVISGQASGNVYLPGSNSSLNQVIGNLYGNGFATVFPDLLFVDFQSLITQSTTLPGFGFQNLSTLPRNQQTQVFINNVSPFVRKSFDGVLDTELRYRFGATNFGGNTLVATAPLVPNLNTLSNSILNEGTFIAATGQDFQRVLARFTADASDFNTSSAARNTQVSAFNDFEYRFTPTIAGLGRVGYQNLRYPLSPAASFAGATWLVGGRLGTLGPDQPAYVSLEYGKQQGVYGFTGSAQVNITPTLLLTANLSQGISSQGQFFQNSLALSTLDPSGAIVNQYSGLPSAFFNPGLGLSNAVFRQHLFNIGLTDAIGPNRYSLFGFYNEQQSLSTQATAPTKTLGVNFVYTRDVRPDLKGYASLGYVNSVNSPTSTTVFGTSTSNINTATSSLGINYLLGPTLTGSIVYSLIYQTNGGTVISSRNGDVVVNQLQFLLSKTF